MFIVLVGSVTIYAYYLKEKKSELQHIYRGFCPKCHSKESIELTDQRSTGCSSPKLVTYTCQECSYSNSFAIDGQGCSR